MLQLIEHAEPILRGEAGLFDDTRSELGNTLKAILNSTESES
jgi:hypothetical protein